MKLEKNLESLVEMHPDSVHSENASSRCESPDTPSKSLSRMQRRSALRAQLKLQKRPHTRRGGQGSPLPKGGMICAQKQGGGPSDLDMIGTEHHKFELESDCSLESSHSERRRKSKALIRNQIRLKRGGIRIQTRLQLGLSQERTLKQSFDTGTRPVLRKGMSGQDTYEP